MEEAVAGGMLGYFGLDFMHSLTGLLTMNLWLADADAVPGTTSAGAPMPSPMPSLDDASVAHEAADADDALFWHSDEEELQPEKQLGHEAEGHLHRCGPGTIWDEASGFCVVDEAAVQETIAAAVKADAASSGWFWWVSWLSPTAWAYYVVSFVLPSSVMYLLRSVSR